jgi:RNA polymerase sigma-70 factor (ECF subfamily)
MTAPSDDKYRILEKFRAYLNLVARIQVDPRLRGKLDLSGVVNQALFQAAQALERLAQWSEGQQQAYLRQMLLNDLRDEVRKWYTQARDVRRDRSLEAACETSSARLEASLAAAQSSPSEQAERHEQELRLAEALEHLPEAQREALVLQHWHGWTLAQIGEHLGRTPAAVAGLLHRGLEQLRHQLPEGE